MPRKRIIIVGKVHDVGYRPFLLGIAGFLGIERFYADNIMMEGKQAVEILLDSSDDKISAFMDLIQRKRPENAVVEEIRAEEYLGDVMRMEDYYRYLTAMQLEKIASYGGQMLRKQDDMSGKMDLMLEKQDEMLKKQDKMLEKQDKMLEKQDEIIQVIKEEGKKTRKMISSRTKLLSSKLDNITHLLEERLKKLEEDVERIKRALIKAGIDIQ